MSILRKQQLQTSASAHTMEFVMSSNRVDAYGDVVEASGWDLTDFRRNPICLINHNPDIPAGRWTNVRIEGDQLLGHLQLAPEGTSARLDEIRRLVEAGILRAASVGFAPIESVPIPNSKVGGRRYTRQRLIECSIVSTPANTDALMTQAKALGVSAATIKQVFRQSVDASLAERQAYARAVLARSRELIAKVDARISREAAEARAKRQPGYLNPRAQKALDEAKEKLEIEREAMRIVRAERDSYAYPKPSWPGEPEPSLYFCGQPMFRKKNKYGW